MSSQFRRLAILSFAVLAIGLGRARGEECDYRTCGALMARDGSASWGVSGRREYAPDTKRACAELNACVRRAKNHTAGRVVAAPAVGSSSLTSGKSEQKQAKDIQPASTGAVHETSGNGVQTTNQRRVSEWRRSWYGSIVLSVDRNIRGNYAKRVIEFQGPGPCIWPNRVAGSIFTSFCVSRNPNNTITNPMS